MNENNLSPKNSSTRRTYHRRNRKGNRTHPATGVYVPLTTTLVSAANNTALINASSVPINDLFAPISYLIQYKYFFFIGLILLILLCLISVLFLVFIFKSTKRKSWRNRREQRKHMKLAQEIPDFLDDHHDHKGENVVLLESSSRPHSSVHNLGDSNGVLLNDNVSNTFSLDPMLEQKIALNNPPNAMSLSPTADDTSLDTLRGSLISSPSQHLPAVQSLPTPTRTSTTDSVKHPEERAAEGEKDDYLQDLDLKQLPQRYIKGASSSNLPAYRTSDTSVGQSIRRQERRAEQEERSRIHGSNTNIYEKELRKQGEQQGPIVRKPHTNSQASLVSRTSEDSCY